jgi:hypothetical protein
MWLMIRAVAQSLSRRDADNELYDFGCNLVEAAAEISRGVAHPGAAPAIPALLGCIEAALYELGRASVVLKDANEQQDESVADTRRQAAGARLQRGYTNLGVALEDARAAARAARSLAVRSRTEGPR